MTEWIWPHEYDRMNMIKMFEHNQKLRTTNFNLLNMTEKSNKNCYNDEPIFGQIQSLIFVVVVIFIIFSIFGQIQSFSVEFNKLTFVIFNFWSCSNI